MVLGFKERFKEPIMKGVKVHTIREDKHNRWKPGMVIQFAIGVRTKKYACFKVGKCVSTQTIHIVYNDHGDCPPIIVIGKVNTFVNTLKTLSAEEVETLAHNDGFDSAAAFFTFFDKDFSGKIIHWTGLRY